MPLVKSTSKKAFSQNVKTERNAGKPLDQSLAIAYSTQRQARRHHIQEKGQQHG